VGQGSTFQVYLPGHPRLGNSDQENPSASPDMLPGGDGQLILLIDDEKSVRTVTSLTLESFGYRIITASNGEEGLWLYAQHHQEVAVVVTDLMMPDMDGLATIHMLRQINPEVKIIGSTGLPTDSQIHAVTQAGACEFLSKPYVADVMLRTLQRVLSA
ncbi:MAG: response regulator, partial [Verrucomicrobiaceae bacterium]